MTRTRFAKPILEALESRLVPDRECLTPWDGGGHQMRAGRTWITGIAIRAAVMTSGYPGENDYATVGTTSETISYNGGANGKHRRPLLGQW